MKRNFALALLLVLFGSTISNKIVAQIQLGGDKLETSISIDQHGDEGTVVLKVTMDDHWHINAVVLPAGNFGYATSFVLTPSNNYKIIGKTIEPTPIERYDEASGEDISYHEGTFLLKRKIKILSEEDFIITGYLDFQTCDESMCLPPFKQNVSVKVKGISIKENQPEKIEVAPAVDSVSLGRENKTADTSQVKGDVSPTDNLENKDTENKEDRSLWGIFIISFISGFAALMTPCVFPMIPMTVSFFTKQSKTKAKGIRNAITFGISIIIIYILLGTVVTAVFGADALNKMSTDPTFNIIFFILLVVFAISFLGAFEIRMPSKWVNKADSKADKGGVIGIFFMALALALVSFSCTGPIVGSLIVEAASEGGIAPIVGMFGFSLALALPFGLFAAFPGWMNSLPQSGGWLNTVKVVLGFLELALAFKFLSNADLAMQSHLLERELFLAIWIGLFMVLTIYLFGLIRLPHDSPVEKLSVGRTLFGTTTLIFALYMIPGLWGAPLKLINAFPPPSNYAESPYGVGGGSEAPTGDHVDGMHLGPQKIMVFDEYDKAAAHAKEVGKPLFIDYTGFNCVNCRAMEETVWGEPGVIEILRNDVVIVSLHQDDGRSLPEAEHTSIDIGEGRMMDVATIGDKWRAKQIQEHNILAQPYYVFQGPDGKFMSNGPADYLNHKDPKLFLEWLEEGLADYKKKYNK